MSGVELVLGKYLTNEEKMGVNRDEFSTDGGRVTESESFHVNGVTETSRVLIYLPLKKNCLFESVGRASDKTLGRCPGFSLCESSVLGLIFLGFVES